MEPGSLYNEMNPPRGLYPWGLSLHPEYAIPHLMQQGLTKDASAGPGQGGDSRCPLKSAHCTSDSFMITTENNVMIPEGSWTLSVSLHLFPFLSSSF